MMPSDEQLQKFVERERGVEQRRVGGLGSDEAVKKWLAHAQGESEVKDAGRPLGITGRGEDAEKTRPQTMNDVPSSSPRPHFNPEAFVSEDDDRMYEQQDNGDSDGAATAAKMFIGVAATSFLAQNPRVRKYLYKKLQK